MAQSSPVAGVVMGLIFTGIGFAGISLGRNLHKKAQAIRSWPSIPGLVGHSDIHSHRGKKSTTYAPEVEYAYTVNGVQYVSKKITLINTSSNYSNAEKVIEKYPRESLVTVYYNPMNPAEAVLELGISSGIYVVLGVGGFFALFGLLILIGSLAGSAIR
jgi:hypothetical protein